MVVEARLLWLVWVGRPAGACDATVVRLPGCGKWQCGAGMQVAGLKEASARVTVGCVSGSGCSRVEEEMASSAEEGGCVGFENGLPFLCVPLGWFFSGKHRLGKGGMHGSEAQGGRAWSGEVVRCRGTASKPDRCQRMACTVHKRMRMGEFKRSVRGAKGRNRGRC